MLVPNLIIAGFYKCATSSVFKWLSAHPDVCGSNVKEPHFLMDEDFPCKYPSIHREGLEGYQRYFSGYKGEKIILEATPGYAIQKTPLDVLGRFNPLPKIIFLIRKPEERLHSSFIFEKYTSAKFKNISSFAEYADILIGDRPASYDIAKYPRDRYIIQNDLKWSIYIDWLQKWAEVFGMGNIFIGLLEDIRKDARAFMQDLCRWLNIAGSFYDGYNFKIYNKSYRLRNQRLHNILKRLGGLDSMNTDTLDKYFDPFNFIRHKRLRRMATRLYTRIQVIDTAIPLTSADREAMAKLRNFFKSHNERLAKEMHLDLSVWDVYESTPRGGL